MMGVVLAAVSVALILLILLDAFETVVLPRRVTRPFRFARLFYRDTWIVWRAAARRTKAGKRRETFLSVFGPLSILLLFSSWAVGLIVAFALLQWSLGTALRSPDGQVVFGTYLYLSGVTFFTLGFGDVTPVGPLGRSLVVTECGVGFGFIALTISYLPVLYQAFSRREVPISMLDARAGSPPSAAQVLLRLAQARRIRDVDPFLVEWERWSAELLESHLSFPLLSYYRSQHDNQSWLAALTTLLDTCSLIIGGVKDADPYQAQLTFAMARHAAVDLALVFQTAPVPFDRDRLSANELARLRQLLREEGLMMREGPVFDEKIAQLREMYEPFVNALSKYFLLSLPAIVPDKTGVDNWQTSAWTKRTVSFGGLPITHDKTDHFV
jgi:voltage-gated potassium channel Kch